MQQKACHNVHPHQLQYAICTSCHTCGCSVQVRLLTQLHQANVFVELCVPGSSAFLTTQLADFAERTYAKCALDAATSQLQRDVGHMLGRLQADDSRWVSSSLAEKLLSH